tara:strand:- start:332 stop:934 length:603 start_codon:yes stop_codon:yes gene_type:complete
MIKQGAMFGLDARIALAIFGALSVISGAALYSAIQDSKAKSFLVDLQELGKAWESYYLDTGSNLKPLDDSDNTSVYFYVLRSGDLVVNPSIAGWKGPYISHEVDPTSGGYPNGYLTGKNGYDYHVMLLNGNDWASYSTGKCTSGQQCYIWSRIWLNGKQEDSIATKLDEIIDNSDGFNKGNFRYDTGFNLKIAPVDNPND